MSVCPSYLFKGNFTSNDVRCAKLHKLSHTSKYFHIFYKNISKHVVWKLSPRFLHFNWISQPKEIGQTVSAQFVAYQRIKVTHTHTLFIIIWIDCLAYDLYMFAKVVIFLYISKYSPAFLHFNWIFQFQTHLCESLFWYNGTIVQHFLKTPIHSYIKIYIFNNPMRKVRRYAENSLLVCKFHAWLMLQVRFIVKKSKIIAI